MQTCKCSQGSAKTMRLWGAHIIANMEANELARLLPAQPIWIRIPAAEEKGGAIYNCACSVCKCTGLKVLLLPGACTFSCLWSTLTDGSTTAACPRNSSNTANGKYISKVLYRIAVSNSHERQNAVGTSDCIRLTLRPVWTHTRRERDVTVACA